MAQETEEDELKFKCSNCKKSFTTIASDQKTKDAFLLYNRNMRCFHCHSSDIELHDDCKGRVIGTTGEANCDGCESYFNCWTGNVDDLSVHEKTKAEKREDEIKIAKERVKQIETREDREEWNNLHYRLEKKGFKYYLKYSFRYIQILGTIWKLKDEDYNAIIKKEWDATKQTKAIRINIEKKGIPLDLVNRYFELFIKINKV